MENVGVRLLLDEHLSRKLVPRLGSLFPETSHVTTLGLDGEDDEAVWTGAKDGGFVITTKDNDFQVMSFARGHPPKVIWLTSGNGPTDEVFEMLVRYRTVIEEFGADDTRSLLVLP